MRQAEELSITTQPCAPILRRPFLRNVAARRHQADVGVGEVIMSSALHFSILSPNDTSGPIERDDASATTSIDGKAALGQNIEHFAPDIARAPTTATLKSAISGFLELLDSPASPLTARPSTPPPGEEPEPRGKTRASRRLVWRRVGSSSAVSTLPFSWFAPARTGFCAASRWNHVARRKSIGAAERGPLRARRPGVRASVPFAVHHRAGMRSARVGAPAGDARAAPAAAETRSL